MNGRLPAASWRDAGSVRTGDYAIAARRRNDSQLSAV